MIKQKKQGQLIVISGPSGAGKDTIVEKVIKKNENIWWFGSFFGSFRH